MEKITRVLLYFLHLVLTFNPHYIIMVIGLFTACINDQCVFFPRLQKKLRGEASLTFIPACQLRNRSQLALYPSLGYEAS